MKAFHHIAKVLLLVAAAAAIASSCNTFKGAGKDIQKGGRAVEDAAVNVESDR